MITEINAYWSSKLDGWHFSYKNRNCWQVENKFVVADIVGKEDGLDGNSYANHCLFKTMEEALNYLRTA